MSITWGGRTKGVRVALHKEEDGEEGEGGDFLLFFPGSLAYRRRGGIGALQLSLRAIPLSH